MGGWPSYCVYLCLTIRPVCVCMYLTRMWCAAGVLGGSILGGVAVLLCFCVSDHTTRVCACTLPVCVLQVYWVGPSWEGWPSYCVFLCLTIQPVCSCTLPVCVLQVYWVGPIMGGVAAAAVYKLLISPYRNCLTMDDAMQKMRE